MGTIQLSISDTAGEAFSAYDRDYWALATATYEAVAAAGEIMKSDARGQVFPRIKGAIRVNTYQNKGIEAAAFLYSSIPYLWVFEEGATIAAKSRHMWLPMPGVPRMIRGKHMTAGRFAQQVAPMIYLKGKRGPVLFARAEAGSLPHKLSEAKTLNARGALKNRKPSLSPFKNASADSKAPLVPVFFGVPIVRIGKRWDIAASAKKASEALPGLVKEKLR
jgi:hypothetical protein